MRIKIFVPNEYGRIELTKEELEKLLNESYQQGWADKPERPYYYQSYPYGTYYTNSDTAITTLTGKADTSYATASTDDNTTAVEFCNNSIHTAKEEIKNTMENVYKVELK